MREILFRGKRTEGEKAGEWAYGDLDTYSDPMIFHGAKHEWGCCVAPETVGQFTGRTDKNGKKVFENDIIVICYETDGEEFSETKKVKYNEKECCWYPMRWEECCEHCDHYTEVKSIEVIGNIHDNPELMEVSDAQ